MTLLVRTECKTFTAAYIVWSSVAKEMRPRRMAGPPMKSRLLAAGMEWNTLMPVPDKGAFHQYIAGSGQRRVPWKPPRAKGLQVPVPPSTHSKGACAPGTGWEWEEGWEV